MLGLLSERFWKRGGRMWASYILLAMILLTCAEVGVLWLNGRLVRGHLRDAAINIGSSLLDKGMTLAIGLTLFAQVYGLAYQHRITTFDNSSVFSWFAAIVISDFLYYWYHRVFHRSRFFWTVHAVHHSSELFNLSTALRSSTIVSLVRWPFWLPMPFLGFTPETTITTYIIVLAYQFWVHTEHIDKVGILESVLMTPSHHRVHHGSNKQYHDKNYGGILCVWDRIFGTFEPEVEPVKYGVTERMESSNLMVINFRDLIRLGKDVVHAKSIKDVLGFLFAPPGWKPKSQEEKVERAGGRIVFEDRPTSAAPLSAPARVSRNGRGVHIR